MKKTIFLLFSVFTIKSIPVLSQLKVYQNGSVSIGSTTAPLWQTRVQIIGNTVFSGNTSTPISSAYIRGLNSFSTALSPDYSWYNNDQVGMFHPASNVIGFSTNGLERVRIDPNGNLGIGLSNPAAKLDVSNSFRLTTWTATILDGSGSSGASVLYPSQTWYLHIGKSTNRIGELRTYHVITDQLTFTSDERVKENINPIENPIEKLKKIKVVKYNFIDSYLGEIPSDIKAQYKKMHIGFIAQNIETIYPELVQITDSVTGLYGVNYFMMIPLLVEAIKQQQIQIEQLQLSSINLTSPTFETIDQKMTTVDNTNKLYQNNPNPFDDKTIISYYIANDNKNSILDAQLLIFDMQGLLKKTYKISNYGKGSIELNSSELSAGMYLYSLLVGGKEIDTKRMILTN